MKHTANIFSFFALAAILALTSCVQETPQTTVPVRGVSLIPKSVELVEGGSKVLTATVSPANATDKSVSFRSNEPSVATVDQDGIVKAISPGEAIVTVTTNDGNYKDHCNVTVLKDVIHVDSVMLNESSLTLKEGESYTLTATVIPDNATDKSVSWSSDAESVASVSQEGIVKALKAGTATITVTTTDSGKSASCTVTVSATIGAVTGGSSNISCRNAKLSGRFNLSGELPSDLKYGVMYSTSPDVPEESAVTLKGTSYNVQDRSYSITTEVLEPETTYYYCAYVSSGGETIRGAVKSFATLPVSTMIKTEEVTDINISVVVLNATLVLTDCIYEKIEYGFELVSKGGNATYWKSSNLSDNKYSCTADGLSAWTEYSCTSYVVLDDVKYYGGNTTFAGGAVDLGISVCWAACNVGASKPEEYGGYYQWAGTQDVTSKSIYLDWPYCPYHEGSDRYIKWKKYIPSDKASYWSGPGSPDNKTVLEPEDDIAHVAYGGSWRIPTIDEWNELIDNCTREGTTINGVNGVMFKSKKNGRSIFLPAGGSRDYDSHSGVGDYGDYWRPSIVKSDPELAYFKRFFYDNGKDIGGADRRYYGKSVRPVLVRE